MRLGNVFSKPAYVLIATIIAWIVFTFAVWLPNVRLIGFVLYSSNIAVVDKLSFIFSLYGSIWTNFTTVSASYTILIALLFGINIALLTFYIRRVRGDARSVRSMGIAGIGGLVSGIFGIGCAACGTFIFTSALTLLGVGGVLAYLPFGGEEFGFLGVALLAYSVYAITMKISEPVVCY